MTHDNEEKDPVNVLEAIKSFVMETPSTEPYPAQHNEWAKVITLATPTRVISTYTLEELSKAMVAGEKVELSYVSHYTQNLFGKVSWDKPSDFLVSTKENENTAVFAIQENVTTVPVSVAQLIRRKPPEYYGNKKADPGEYWSAVLIESGSYERNYNAGWESWTRTLVVHCNGEVFTWEKHKEN